MTTMLASSRLMAGSPRPIRWTCGEFHRFGDLGMFEGRHAMLIDGSIMEEGPMNPPHAITLEIVEETLRKAFQGDWRIRSQSPLVLGQDLDPEPDFAVLAGSARGSVGHPTTADLVVEVADSSITFDTNDKRLIYAQARIPEYWVVDINGRRVHVFRDPVAGDYTTQRMNQFGDSISPLALPGRSVQVADLLE